MMKYPRFTVYGSWLDVVDVYSDYLERVMPVQAPMSDCIDHIKEQTEVHELQDGKIVLLDF